MSEWITDRKPTEFGEYLVTLPDGDSRYVGIETFHPEDGWDSLYKVLAWQELPKPYDGAIKDECIPVSWIAKWLEKQMDSFKNTTSQYNVKEFVRMILDWEKENDGRNC